MCRASADSHAYGPRHPPMREVAVGRLFRRLTEIVPLACDRVPERLDSAMVRISFREELSTPGHIMCPGGHICRHAADQDRMNDSPQGCVGTPMMVARWSSLTLASHFGVAAPSRR